MRVLLKWALSTLYGLVMIELAIMISPFAFYWYSLYAPVLQRFHQSEATAWLDAFFLPHSVITTSPALEFLRWRIGTYCLSLGILGFLFCAAQVYGSKLLRRGVVHSWIYSRIRHPQYLCLAIAGFGLLTMWPRIVILVLYAGMLVSYYFLARFEEKQMEGKHSEYAAYRDRTAMFIPGSPGKKLFGALFGWIPNRRVALAASVAATFAFMLGTGLLLRQYSIAHAASQPLPAQRTLAIAVWPMPREEIQRVVSVALQDDQVRAALAGESGAVFTAHILPADYGMVDMFADVDTDHRMFSRVSPSRFKYLLGFAFPFFKPHRYDSIMGTAQENYRVVFSRVDVPRRGPVSLSDVTSLDAKMTPVVIVDIQGTPATLRNVTVPPRRSLWGDITMPMF